MDNPHEVYEACCRWFASHQIEEDGTVTDTFMTDYHLDCEVISNQIEVFPTWKNDWNDYIRQRLTNGRISTSKFLSSMDKHPGSIKR